MAKKKSASSPRERRLTASALFTTPIRDSERAEIERLSGMRDSDIGYSDAPAMKSFPTDIHVGRFYRPVRQQTRQLNCKWELRNSRMSSFQRVRTMRLIRVCLNRITSSAYRLPAAALPGRARWWN
jgi:hypothetical protein